MSRNLFKEIISADVEFIKRTLDDMTPEKFREFCFDAMKQQDRDTRHACAEAISASCSCSEGSRSVMNCRSGLPTEDKKPTVVVIGSPDIEDKLIAKLGGRYIVTGAISAASLNHSLSSPNRFSCEAWTGAGLSDSHQRKSFQKQTIFDRLQQSRMDKGI